MLDTSRRFAFDDEHHLFRDQALLVRELVPRFEHWEAEGTPTAPRGPAAPTKS